MNFVKSVTEPEKSEAKAYYFIYSKSNILVRKEFGCDVSIPLLDHKSVLAASLRLRCFFGTMDNMPCYCASMRLDELPEGYQWMSIRALYGKMDDTFYTIAGYARQIFDWNVNFQFCGRCGEKTQKKEEEHPDVGGPDKKEEHSRICPECGLISYPRISPAIITAVIKDDQILLARGVNFPDKRMFSVLAGFVEPGESLEDCVKREILEETGIKVKKIQYFKSQSWPFPDSLMIGFTAVYESGKISIDRKEIVEADWFKYNRLPVIPGRQSLARELIDWFVTEQGRPFL